MLARLGHRENRPQYEYLGIWISKFFFNNSIGLSPMQIKDYFSPCI